MTGYVEVGVDCIVWFSSCHRGFQSWEVAGFSHTQQKPSICCRYRELTSGYCRTFGSPSVVFQFWYVSWKIMTLSSSFPTSTTVSRANFWAFLNPSFFCTRDSGTKSAIVWLSWVFAHHAPGERWRIGMHCLLISCDSGVSTSLRFATCRNGALRRSGRQTTGHHGHHGEANFYWLTFDGKDSVWRAQGHTSWTRDVLRRRWRRLRSRGGYSHRSITGMLLNAEVSRVVRGRRPEVIWLILLLYRKVELRGVDAVQLSRRIWRWWSRDVCWDALCVLMLSALLVLFAWSAPVPHRSQRGILQSVFRHLVPFQSYFCLQKYTMTSTFHVHTWTIMSNEPRHFQSGCIPHAELEWRCRTGLDLRDLVFWSGEGYRDRCAIHHPLLLCASACVCFVCSLVFAWCIGMNNCGSKSKEEDFVLQSDTYVAACHVVNNFCFFVWCGILRVFSCFQCCLCCPLEWLRSNP